MDWSHMESLLKKVKYVHDSIYIVQKKSWSLNDLKIDITEDIQAKVVILKIDIEMNTKWSVWSQYEYDIRNHELARPYCCWFIYVNICDQKKWNSNEF
jgi:hypothetical protein